MNFNNIDSELDFMIKHDITAEELYIFKMIMYCKNYGNALLIGKYMSTVKNKEMFFKKLLKMTEHKVFTKRDQVNLDKFNLNDWNINKLFLKDYEKTALIMGSELKDVYPDFIYINGNHFSIKTIHGKFNSFEDAFRSYGKEIGYSNIKHNEILQLIEWSKLFPGMINYTFDKFIVNNSWDSLINFKKLYDKGELDGAMFNTTTMI